MLPPAPWSARGQFVGYAEWSGGCPSAEPPRSKPPMKLPSNLGLCALVLAAALGRPGSAHAQAFNIDIGASALPVPTAIYGAGAGQIGVWNAIGDPWQANLVDVTGSATGVLLSSTGPDPAGNGIGDFDAQNAGTSGDDEALFDDVLDIGGEGFGTTFTFTGLADGEYEVFSYSFAPDIASYRTTVEVLGSSDPPRVSGGAWPGTPALLVTHVRHAVTVAGGAPLQVVFTTLDGFGSVNGFQIVPAFSLPVGSNYCVTLPNSTGSSAEIEAFGTPSVAARSLSLRATGLPASVSGLFYFGANQLFLPFGDGLRCAGGSAFRLPLTSADAAGVALEPDIWVHGVAGVQLAVGSTWNFQQWYRDPGGMAGFNLSDGLAITFEP